MLRLIFLFSVVCGVLSRRPNPPNHGRDFSSGGSAMGNFGNKNGNVNVGSRNGNGSINGSNGNGNHGSINRSNGNGNHRSNNANGNVGSGNVNGSHGSKNWNNNGGGYVGRVGSGFCNVGWLKTLCRACNSGYLKDSRCHQCSKCFGSNNGNQGYGGNYNYYGGNYDYYGGNQGSNYGGNQGSNYGGNQGSNYGGNQGSSGGNQGSSGSNKGNNDQCSLTNKCAKGYGDCQSDLDCLSGLFCGKNNCKGEFGGKSPSGAPWDRKDDCCTDNKKYCNPKDLIPYSRKTCCSKFNPCPFMHGDCDKDSDCQSGLICGDNNCKDFHEGAGNKDDCCTRPDKRKRRSMAGNHTIARAEDYYTKK